MPLLLPVLCLDLILNEEEKYECVIIEALCALMIKLVISEQGILSLPGCNGALGSFLYVNVEVCTFFQMMLFAL